MGNRSAENDGDLEGWQWAITMRENITKPSWRDGSGRPTWGRIKHSQKSSQMITWVQHVNTFGDIGKVWILCACLYMLMNGEKLSRRGQALERKWKIMWLRKESKRKRQRRRRNENTQRNKEKTSRWVKVVRVTLYGWWMRHVCMGKTGGYEFHVEHEGSGGAYLKCRMYDRGCEWVCVMGPARIMIKEEIIIMNIIINENYK